MAVAEIRQKCRPASSTELISNLSLKDKVFYGALVISELSLLVITDGGWAVFGH
jgi:hypothetical protein